MHLPRIVSNRFGLLVPVVLISIGAFGQRPAHFENAKADFTHAHELFDMAKYSAAQYEMERVVGRIRDPHDATRIEAEFYSAICAVRLLTEML